MSPGRVAHPQQQNWTWTANGSNSQSHHPKSRSLKPDTISIQSRQPQKVIHMSASPPCVAAKGSLHFSMRQTTVFCSETYLCTFNVSVTVAVSIEADLHKQVVVAGMDDPAMPTGAWRCACLVAHPTRQCPVSPKYSTVTSKYHVPSVTPCVALA